MFSRKTRRSILAKPLFVIYDKWFFISEKGQHLNACKNPLLVAHTGEDFGYKFIFSATKPTVKINIELTVPHSPENFPFHDCKHGELHVVGNTIKINTDINTRDGWYGFYWGIGAEDPRGRYQVSFALGGLKINSTTFHVE